MHLIIKHGLLIFSGSAAIEITHEEAGEEGADGGLGDKELQFPARLSFLPPSFVPAVSLLSCWGHFSETGLSVILDATRTANQPWLILEMP